MAKVEMNNHGAAIVRLDRGEAVTSYPDSIGLPSSVVTAIAEAARPTPKRFGFADLAAEVDEGTRRLAFLRTINQAFLPSADFDNLIAAALGNTVTVTDRDERSFLWNRGGNQVRVVRHGGTERLYAYVSYTAPVRL
jgi:hypothetical protein